MAMPAVTILVMHEMVTTLGSIQVGILEYKFGHFNPVDCKMNNFTLVHHLDGKN